MDVIGPTASFTTILIVYLLRTILYTILCSLIGWIGVHILDWFTPQKRVMRMIGQNAKATAIFIAGYFLFIGIILHGVLVNPVAIGSSIWGSLIDLSRIFMILMFFGVSLLICLFLLFVLDKLTPSIPFEKIYNDPLACAIQIFGYLLCSAFLMHAALSSSF